ncbi:MAG: lipid-A-disaccharide synthase [Bacteroidaceae bacterium]|nr:lipid-A-disaccharide synthase [Bacteroidaceae bacterium]
MKYYLIAGEASGDLHASNLMKALLRNDAGAQFRFLGGDLMAAVGGTLVRHYKELAYMGFVQVALHARTILRNMDFCRKDIVDWNPDVVILVDYPGFNLKIAHYIHSNTKIPVYYYISPKIWAWKTRRINNIRRDVDEVFSILPFEIPFYESYGYKVRYVGNPCLDAVEDYQQHAVPREEFLRANSLNSKPVLALLPGSRKQEIKGNLSRMLEAASSVTDCQIVIAGAPGISPSFYDKYLHSAPSRKDSPETPSAEKGSVADAQQNIRIVFNQAYPLLQNARAALVTSGTATLETALFLVPQVVCYHIRCGKLVDWLRRIILKVRFISLVNLIANKEVVKELVADKMNPQAIRRELQQIWPEGEKRQEMLQSYEEMLRALGEPGASERAAKEIVSLLS